MAAGKVEMTQEDKAYFKNGVKTLCGTELIFATKVINDLDIKKIFTQGDLDFMNKELGRRIFHKVGESAFPVSHQ